MWDRLACCLWQPPVDATLMGMTVCTAYLTQCGEINFPRGALRVQLDVPDQQLQKVDVKGDNVIHGWRISQMRWV